MDYWLMIILNQLNKFIFGVQNEVNIYQKYWDIYDKHFIEKMIIFLKRMLDRKNIRGAV